MNRATFTTRTITGLRINGNRVLGYTARDEDGVDVGRIVQENGCLRFVPVVEYNLAAQQLLEIAVFMTGVAEVVRKEE